MNITSIPAGIPSLLFPKRLLTGKCVRDGLALAAILCAGGLGGDASAQTDANTLASPWGIASSAGSSGSYSQWFPKMSAAGVTWTRMFPEWGGFEPQKGVWKFDGGDKMVHAAASNNIQMSGLLFGAPSWVAPKFHTFPMQHLDDWSNFAAKLAEHYKGDIHYWEVWNEGNGGFNDAHSTTADYAALVTSAYAAVKKVDPTAQVGMSVASFDAPYFDQAILAQAKAGTPNSFDYLCIHPYETVDGFGDPDGEIPYLWMSHLLREGLKADAPAKANAEIWITEIGAKVGKSLTEADAARIAVRCYVLADAQGIRHTCWFEAQDPSNEPPGYGFLKQDGTPRPALAAFKTMTTCLGKNPTYRGWLALGAGGKGYGFVFQGASTPVLAAWMPVGGTDKTVTFQSAVQVIEALGGTPATLPAGQPLTLTDSPVFVTGLPADQVAKAQSQIGKNFPWGGDYSTAETVSVQLGTPEGGRGVFQTHRTATPNYTFPDGSTGIQVAGDIGHPVTFYVHPSFAGFKMSEYYIRLTTRRIGPGNVGMNFQYEVADTKGQGGPMRHSGGWYSVSKDDGWQTHTWHVTGACFSKMWGYDFTFNPEQSVPFVIGKVEVSTKPFN